MKNKDLHFLSRLTNYSLQSILIRLMLVAGTGLLFLFFAVEIVGDDTLHISLKEYLQVVLIFIVISESNVLVDHFAERFFPIPERLSIRVVLHILVSLIISVLAVSYFFLMMKDVVFFSLPIVQLMIFFGSIFIFILTLVSITLRIIEQWIYSIRQLEEYKNLKLKGDYISLQEQLNPHFLFNNLSVLKSMIKYEPKDALQFVQNFTDVYRYFLQSRERTTVKVSEELELIEAYTAIHKERMGEAFELDIDVNDEDIGKEIPPLALQLLVENAIKHNIALKSDPLIVKISSDNNMITVTNTLNFKESSFSEKRGLENLRLRYEFLTDKRVVVSEENSFFTVKIPLL